MMSRAAARLGRVVRAVTEPRPASLKDLSGGLPPMGARLGPPFFQGSFASYRQADDGGANPYDDAPWVETANFAVERLIERTREPDFTIDAHLLPFAAALSELAGRRDHLNVLDFGGGAGDNFLQLQAVLAPSVRERLAYQVADTPRNCEAGRRLLGTVPGLSFHSEIPQAEAPFDAVMLCGTLMYIEDWSGLLKTLAARTADCLYVTRSPANLTTPTFYVKQLIVPGQGPWAGRFVGATPMAVINPNEIRELLDAAGFEQALFARLFSYGPEMCSASAPYNAVFQAMSLFVRRGSAMTGERGIE